MSSNKITINDNASYEISDSVCDKILNFVGENSSKNIGSGTNLKVPPCIDCNNFFGSCQLSAGQQLSCINHKFKSFKGRKK